MALVLRRSFICLYVLCVLAYGSDVRKVEHPEDLVDIQVGTDTTSGSMNSNGNTFPQVKLPWGFNDWVPQTQGNAEPWWHARDYVTYEGMRCTHQPSPWINDYGYFTILPLSGPDNTHYHRTHLYAQKLSTFKPYHFRTTLRTLDNDIDFELTPTNHAASMRVKFDSRSTDRRIVIQVPDGVLIADKGGILGYTADNHGGTPPNYKMFITVQMQNPIARTWLDNNKTGIIAFGNEQEEVTITVATSFISQAQAVESLQREIASKSFDEVLAEAKAVWNRQLSVYDVETVDATSLKVFYTNLWKASLFPRFLTEVDSTGAEIHFSPYSGKVVAGKLAADSGFWDAYRTVYTLQSMAFPENLGKLIDAWLSAYSEAGWLPQWASPGQRGSMVGTMADVSLADAIVKSQWGLISDFNVTKAYEAIRKDAYVQRSSSDPNQFGRAALEQYVKLGYIAERDFPNHEDTKTGTAESVSRSMNDYVADAAIAHAAASLGYTADAADLFARSRRYDTLFNTKSLFFQPKSPNGTFYEPFDPLAWRWGFTESGPWQYRFYVPHDVAGLVKLYGGSLCSKVEEMLTTRTGPAFHVGGYGSPIHEQTEAQALFDQGFGYYAHNNQPVHHVLWLAKKAGCNAIADQYLRRTMAEMYTLRGYSGDEDNGEMAAWYVLSALGLYQLENAADELVVGSPAIVSATLLLPRGRSLRVTTEGQHRGNSFYVSSATWTPEGGSARAVEGNALKFTEVMKGGSLHFVLMDDPLTPLLVV